MRRSLAGEVRREEQPLAPGRPAFRLLLELAEICGEHAAQPGCRARRAQHHAHRVPRVGDGMAEGVQSRLGVVRVGGKCREDDARRAEDDRDRAWVRDADPERRRCLVAGSGDLGRLVCGRQPLERDLERRADLLRPGAPAHVEEKRPRGVGDVGRELSGEAQPDVVLG